MNVLPSFFRGDDIALEINVSGDDVSLEEYDIDASFFVYGRTGVVRASSHRRDMLPVMILAATKAGINLPASETAILPAGRCSVEVTYTHRATAARRTFRNELFVLNDLKKNGYGEYNE